MVEKLDHKNWLTIEYSREHSIHVQLMDMQLVKSTDGWIWKRLDESTLQTRYYKNWPNF